MRNPSRRSAQVPPKWQRGAVDDPAVRARAHRIALRCVAVAIAVGLCVWLIPLPFDDPPAIRKVLVALLIGFGAAYLAWIVVTKMSEAVKASEEPETYEHAQPDPVLRLAGVDMREATLPGADLGRAELTGALLEGADLNAATLHASRLAGADLRESDLRGADLRLSDLSRTDLRGADLRGALLSDADVAGALYDKQTRWPSKEPPPNAIRAGDVSDPDL